MSNTFESAKDYFLELVKHDTTSKDDAAVVPSVVPSTKGQLPFAEHLVGICAGLGLSDVWHDGHGYVYAVLPGNADAAVIGFIAHTDTSPACSGLNVAPNVVENYQGGDITLPNGVVMSASTFPDLNKYVGQDIITSGGGTLLGADDKAGIAAILSAVKYLSEHGEIKRGDIKIAFTPDEEIGHGAELLDLDRFGAEFAYTVDGGEVGEFERECFNAAAARYGVAGVSTHPGTAKGVLVNAAIIAAEIALSFPRGESPEATEGREGFYHVGDAGGGVERATVDVILRDFDKEGLARRKRFAAEVAERLNRKYNGAITLEIKDQYPNMSEVFEGKGHIIDLALRSMRDCGVTPIEKPIRGGTDGARLSFRGLPCPNIFTGGHNAHGPFEFLPVPSLYKCAEVIVKIAENAAKR